MHDRRGEIRGRLRRVVDQHVRPAARRHVADLTVAAWHVPPAADGTVGEPVPFGEAKDQEYAAFAIGDRWGPAWATTWFRLTGEVPADLAHPELVVDLGFAGTGAGFQAEGLVLRPDGTHVKALNPLNDWVPAVPGERVDLYVEAAANPQVHTSWNPTALGDNLGGDKLTSSADPVYRLTAAAVVEVAPEVRELLADVEVLDQLAAELAEDDARQAEILLALEAALDALDLADVPGTASAARSELAGVLGRPAYGGAHRVSAVGHAHIDSAWLWPVRESVRKVARTVANVVNLLDSGAELVYAMSSAQQWEWLREHHPALFERVKEHVAAGRFVPVGGMWVESDTNMVGGEAMARQFLVGQRWFEEHLGVTCEEVWLPDSFGYTAALPQIVRLAGCRWFLTQKISWNTTNVFPHHTFWWEGIDGTRVFTHFPPVDTYNAELTGRELAHAARNFRDKGAATRSLVPFGHGDGGGGPTREMLGARRAHRVPRRLPDRRRRDAGGVLRGRRGGVRPVIAGAGAGGELYLEIHRGTYTSQAAMKQGNRRSEHLLREAELWCSTAAVRGLLAYPADELEEIWRTVLLHQFHDILPGSSIAWVHREARATYAEVAARLEALIDRALDALAGDGDDAIVFNAGPVARNGVAALGGGFEAQALTAFVPQPPIASVVEVRGAPATSLETTFENERLRVELDDGRRDPASSRQGARPRGATARGRGEPPPAAPRPPGEVGRVGPRQLLPQEGHRPGQRRPWQSRRHRRGQPLVRRILSQATDPARRRPAGGRDAGRLARTREGPQGRLRRRRPHRPRGVRDSVRPRRPADPREHHLGRSPVRGVRAPVGARGRGGVRRGDRQRLDLRPRRDPPPARGWWHVLAGPAQPAARAAVPRPGDRPGPARVPVRTGARRRHRRAPPRRGTR